MKDVVIIANFVGGLQGKDNNRFVYLAGLLAKCANVELVVSDFNHGPKSRRDGKFSDFPFKISMLHETGYPKNVCLKRFYSHAVWGKNVKKYLEQRKKPDLIYCAVPSMDGAKAAAAYSKKNGVPFIIDVQDLWPEAFKMVFSVPVLSDVIFVPMMAAANRIYAQADEIIAVSDVYCARAKSANKKSPAAHTVFLGTDISVFDQYAAEQSSVKKPENELWLAYCGTLGSSYDLACVFDALKLLEERGAHPPKFIVMGDGPRKREFEEYAAAKGVDIVFTGKLPYAEMCALLKKCDITVNPITKGAAQSIINKHADYAASGLPVLNTQECEEYRRLVDEYVMGFNCENGNVGDLADKLENLMDDGGLRAEMGKNARRCAEERFDRAKTYGEIVETVTSRMN